MRVREGRGSVKTPFFILKNIKSLLLWIDNISAIVYYLIKIRDKEKQKNGNQERYNY